MLKGNVDRGKISEETLLNREAQIEKEALDRFLKESSKRDRENVTMTASDDMLIARKRVINKKDSLAMERILGQNDLVPILYLQKGFEVGKSVCRITIRNKVGNVIGSGTGFMIGNGIIMTNNHVIPDIDTAMCAIAEFNYQNDENFMPCQIYYYKMNPKKFFITDKSLDFTIIAIKKELSNGKSYEDFGYIKLIPEEGKVMEGEYVSIIQHPKGGPKSVTLRENKVKHIFDDYLHYMTDTEPGSSGSPVFNDQWIVVGLHHSGVPNPDSKGEWIANEGIRISSIANFIGKEYSNLNSDGKKIVGEIFPDLKIKNLNDDQKNDYKDDDTSDDIPTNVRTGYNPNFLGKDFKVDLPKLNEKMEKDVSRMKDGNYVLDYVHFSIVMCKSRGLAYFTAVNIDGENLVKIKRSDDDWCFDTRINIENQYGNEVYNKNDLDRGHLVRRNDPNWGEHAYQANEDTFHFTNSAPQHKDLNQKIWLGLEDYILKNADKMNIKVSVFTGPVFKEDDMIYRKKFKIPADFWKVVTVVKDDGTLSATAYIQTQENMIDDLEFAYGAYETYQVPVRKIEELTGLDFGDLSKYDPIANVEFSGLRITDENDIRL